MSRPGRLAVAALLALGAGGCRRKAPAFATLPEPHTTFDLSVHRDAKDAGAPAPLLTGQDLSPELRKLVDAAHAHPAVGSLEAAGCELALVMAGHDYDRFVDLRHGKPMPAQAVSPVGQVVYCQSRATPPPDCAQLAPIFARVARPKLPFQVLSGYVDPPFAPRCSGQHDAAGKYLGGEGPGYPSR
jgi:hypothetical protein